MGLGYLLCTVAQALAAKYSSNTANIEVEIMRKLQLIFVLGFLMTSNAFAKVVVESVSCGDKIFDTPVDMYFGVTDFGKLWSQFSKSVQNQDKDSSDKKSRNDLNE